MYVVVLLALGHLFILGPSGDAVSCACRHNIHTDVIIMNVT